MSVRIEIRGLPAAAGQAIVRSAPALGVTALHGCRVVRLYFLAQDPGPEALGRLCTALLADPVLEQATWGTLDGAGAGAKADTGEVAHMVEVAYRPGVTDVPARELLRGHTQELSAEKVQALRKSLGLEDGAETTLTLQPVIGQRRAAKATVHVGHERGPGQAYVNGHNTADEGRELRRFDHVREDRRGRGGKKPHGGLTVSGEMAAKQSQKPFKQRKEKGPRPLPDGNPAAFRTWYVPEGVDTGPSGHRNAGPGGKPRYGKPGGKPGGGKPGNKAEVEKELKAMLGVKDIVWFKKGIEGDDTDGHIDDIVRFIREDAVICMVEPRDSDPNHKVLKEIRERLNK